MRSFLVTLLIGDSPTINIVGLKVQRVILDFDQTTHPTHLQLVAAAKEKTVKQYAPAELIGLYEFKSEQEISEFVGDYESEAYTRLGELFDLRSIPLASVGTTKVVNPSRH